MILITIIIIIIIIIISIIIIIIIIIMHDSWSVKEWTECMMIKNMTEWMMMNVEQDWQHSSLCMFTHPAYSHPWYSMHTCSTQTLPISNSFSCTDLRPDSTMSVEEEYTSKSLNSDGVEFEGHNYHPLEETHSWFPKPKNETYIYILNFKKYTVLSFVTKFLVSVSVSLCLCLRLSFILCMCLCLSLCLSHCHCVYLYMLHYNS